MAALELDTLNALESLLDDLLDGITPAPQVAIEARQIKLAGLGGYVGHHRDPEGDILGGQIDALVTVTVQDNPSRIADVNNALLGLTPAERRENSILKLRFDSAETVTGQGGSRRALRYALLFEHLRVPDEGEGIIQEIPIQYTVEEDNG